MRLVAALAVFLSVGWLAAGASRSATTVSPPTRVSATGWNASAFVRWRQPTSTGGSTIARYEVTTDPGGVVTSVPGSQTWARVGNLQNGVEYSFRVAAISQGSGRSEPSPPTGPVLPQPVAIHVQGAQLVNAAGQPVRLFGVNRSGSEYACVIGGTAGAGIFDGPADAASIATIASWHVNAVRISLNEDCWLGINGVNPAYAGTAYQAAIGAYVTALNDAGLVAVLDLHWNAPGSALADRQQLMADADHAPDFWANVATYFKSNPGVIFDLYNEPRDISWSCWRNGCQTKEGWTAVGMQQLIGIVRGTGATQPIMVGGLSHANDLSQWLAQRLHDPLRQLVASVHIYNSGKPPDYCGTDQCWDQTIAAVASKVPVVTGELGEFDRNFGFITSYMRWADAQAAAGRSVSYLAFAWDAALGEGGPSVIASWDGTPTRFGLGFLAHMNRLFRAGLIVEG